MTELPIITSNRKRHKFVISPDRDFVAIPSEADRSIYFADDPEFAACDTLKTPQIADPGAIAKPLLACIPSGVAAILYDNKGRILGASITPAPRGFTPGPFIAAIRSAPTACKRITFATTSAIPAGTIDAVNQASDVLLMHIADFLVVSAY